MTAFLTNVGKNQKADGITCLGRKLKKIESKINIDMKGLHNQLLRIRTCAPRAIPIVLQVKLDLRQLQSTQSVS